MLETGLAYKIRTLLAVPLFMLFKISKPVSQYQLKAKTKVMQIVDVYQQPKENPDQCGLLLSSLFSFPTMDSNNIAMGKN